MSLYENLINPIKHLGGESTVSAAELRNCLGKVAEVLETEPAEKSEPVQEVKTEPAEESEAESN